MTQAATAAPKQIMTVMGPARAEWNGAVDAHSHIWIDPLAGASAAGWPGFPGKAACR